LKADPYLAGVGVIFLSAHAQESARQEALAAGAKSFLAKPYDALRLLSAIEAATDTAAG
jgi:CheY-like chemotaxis protein